MIARLSTRGLLVCFNQQRGSVMNTTYKIAMSVLVGAALGAAAVQGLHAQAKPKAYIVTESDVIDAASLAAYTPQAQAAATQDALQAPVQDAIPAGNQHQPELRAKGLETPRRPSHLEYSAPTVDGEGGVVERRESYAEYRGGGSGSGGAGAGASGGGEEAGYTSAGDDPAPRSRRGGGKRKKR